MKHMRHTTYGDVQSNAEHITRQAEKTGRKAVNNTYYVSTTWTATVTEDESTALRSKSVISHGSRLTAYDSCQCPRCTVSKATLWLLHSRLVRIDARISAPGSFGVVADPHLAATLLYVIDQQILGDRRPTSISIPPGKGIKTAVERLGNGLWIPFY